MAYNREDFKTTVRKHLEYAFDEFICLQLERALGQQEYSDFEVKSLLKSIVVLMERKRTTTTFPWRKKALEEVIYEASFDKIVRQARSRMKRYYPELKRQINDLPLITQAEFPKMMKAFLPQYAKLALNARKRKHREDILENIRIEQERCDHEIDKGGKICEKCGWFAK